MKKRPPLFALMLAAFVTVIVLGFCGTGMVLVLSTGITQGIHGESFRSPRAVVPTTTTPGAVGISTPVPPYTAFRDGFDWRAPLSALLAFAAVLLGGAAFFSN